MHLIGLIVLVLFVCGVYSQHHHGLTLMCRHCHNVDDPRSCSHMEACHEQCGTEVHFLDNAYKFTYSCMEKRACDEQVSLVGKRGRHEHGQLVCRECCTSSGCDSNTCSHYFSRTTTPAPVTDLPTTTAAIVNGYVSKNDCDQHISKSAGTYVQSDPSCRDYETATFQCAEFEKYNFCTDTTSVAYAIAHEKCAKHCGFCSPYHNVVVTHAPATNAPATNPPATMAPTTAEPLAATTIMSGDFSTTTVYAQTPVVVVVNVTQPLTDGNAASDCADHDDPTLTCADMKKFGFCAPDSGAGYTFALLRCKQTCNLC